MKREKGITLLAIVITIVILIILGVITVNFLFGQNGLIDKLIRRKCANKRNRCIFSWKNNI